MSFTFVTALYEIHREEHDNRSFSMYQEWFSKTLLIPFPLVIYTEEKNREMIERIRKDLPTRTIYTTLDEVPFYYTTPSVQHIIQNTDFKYRIKHPNGLENKCYEYIPVITSKFKWMMSAIESNFFNTNMFFWIDAGLSRFISFDITSQQYNTELIARLHANNLLYFQIGKEKELMDILHNPSHIESYIGTNTNFIMAGFFGGNKDILYTLCHRASKLYISEFMEKNQVDNEQTLIGYVLPDYKDKLYLVQNDSHQNYMNYYVFCNRVYF